MAFLKLLTSFALSVKLFLQNIYILKHGTFHNILILYTLSINQIKNRILLICQIFSYSKNYIIYNKKIIFFIGFYCLQILIENASDYYY